MALIIISAFFQSFGKNRTEEEKNKPDSNNANPDCMVNMMNVLRIIQTASTDSFPASPPNALSVGLSAILTFVV